MAFKCSMEFGVIFSLFLCFSIQISSIDGCNLTVEVSANHRRCYNIVHQSLTLSEANSACYNSYGGGVVTVTSAHENDVVQSLMQEHGLLNVWLGVYEEFSTWRWLDGRETLRQGCFWDDLTSTDFVERNTVDNNTFSVCEERCRQRNYKYSGLQGGIYCWCGNSFGKYGHSENGCNMLCGGDPNHACGGQRANTVLAVQGTYSNWLNGQPNNHLGYQTCTIADPTELYQWLDVSCSDRQAFICYLDNIQLCDDLEIANATVEHVLNVTETSCMYVSLVYSTWFRARETCLRVGGDLLTVDHVNITDLLFTHINPLQIQLESAGFWIGLQRSMWQLNTYERMTYSNWADGKPNGADQNCAVISEEGQWDDVQCDGSFNVICETDSVINYETSTTTSSTTSTSTTTAKTTTTSTTTTSTTTTKPPRKKPRIHDSERGISDEHMASIVAGGTGMLIIIVIVLTVSCVISRRNRKRRKEEKEDEKREKYFFGLDGDPGETTLQRTSNEYTSYKTDHYVMPTNDESQAVNSTYENPTYENELLHTEEDAKNEITVVELNGNRLSGKPDVVPD